MPHPQRRLRFTALVLIVLTVPLLAVAPAAAESPSSYVALGDSYTAGPLVLPQDPTPFGCFRSALNYPHLLQARYRFTSFTDVSCSGAQTKDMFAPQVVGGESNPPQLDALQPSTQLVTVQVGGNDIGFSEIAISCVALLPLGAPCQTMYVAGGVDEISRRITETAPKIDRVLEEIKRRSPDAEVYLIGYPSLFPEGSMGCWPVMPYAQADVPYLISKELELNAMLAARAAANGVTFVDTYTPSIGHDACALPLVRWVEPVLLPLMGFLVHPNFFGMAGMEAATAAAIGRDSPYQADS